MDYLAVGYNNNMKFTVFTASYNRAHTLPGLFDSLTKQTFKDFEWLIVDDGSTDQTAELVNQFKQSAHFHIHFLSIQHQGKMAAHNAAFPHVRGLFFLNVDSDDYLYSHTLARLSSLWNSIPADKKKKFAGLTCLSANPNNQIIGKDFGIACTDSSFDEMYQQGRMRGDRLELWLSDILRQFPYPDFSNEHFVPDGLIYHQISRHYLVRFVNEALQVVVYQPDGITHNSIYYRAKNPHGMMHYYQDMLNHLTSNKERIRCGINFYRYYLHSRSQKNSMSVKNKISFYFPLKLSAHIVYFYDVVYICFKNKPSCA